MTEPSNGIGGIYHFPINDKVTYCLYRHECQGGVVRYALLCLFGSTVPPTFHQHVLCQHHGCWTDYKRACEEVETLIERADAVKVASHLKD